MLQSGLHPADGAELSPTELLVARGEADLCHAELSSARVTHEEEKRRCALEKVQLEAVSVCQRNQRHTNQQRTHGTVHLVMGYLQFAEEAAANIECSPCKTSISYERA